VSKSSLLRLEGKGVVFYYELIKVSEDYSSYLDYIAKKVEDNFLYNNKKLECRKTVVVNEAV